MFSKLLSKDNTNSVSSSLYDQSTSTDGPTFSETALEDIIDNAEQIIQKWNLDARFSTTNLHDSHFQSLFTQENIQEAQQFLGSIRDSQQAMPLLRAENSRSAMVLRAHNLTKIAMKRVEKEFHYILKTYRTTILSPESVSQSFNEEGRLHSGFIESEADKINELIMTNIRSIADCMITSGYKKECVFIYKIVRKSVIDEALYNLGFYELEHSSQMSQIKKLGWDSLEVKMRNWRAVVRTPVKTLFRGERVLCDHVFSNLEKDNIGDACLAEICQDRALSLFSFVENVAKNKKILSPEKIFMFLNMYEDPSGLRDDIEMVFSSDYFSNVKSQAKTSLLKLAEAVRVMLTQFESAIDKDTPKTALPGGTIHPLTRYVMNYLVALSDYSDSLADIIAGSPSAPRNTLPAFYFASPDLRNGHLPERTISVRLAWIILMLISKLDCKAELYKDHVALSYLFLANNLNYTVSRVKTTPKLVLLLGYDWISTHESKVKQYIEKYERIVWAKTLASFPNDPTADIPSAKITECFRLFNAGFEKAYQEQSSWVIPDPILRDEVKVSIYRKLVLTYQVFYEKHRTAAVESIIRYATEDLVNCLSDLFVGKDTVSRGGPSGSSTATVYDEYFSRLPSSSQSPSSSWER
ncbi:OLC1v1004174C1 [Oldenlandia corymbosa var. corymbosa]|uniref:Exocyst subunit Exo70 family protein n=1 Tax=Oldenlandia corymbosa var. corymbosa TaxID=529605 RepID=A0AAV1DF23_OLDCO|nr:OLC1v1004174C1 [Oldenlandia corymbosa var. corymbosa]